MTAAGYASPLDAARHGEHRVHLGHHPPRFAARLDRGAGALHPPEAGRYHLYGGPFCPRSHRAAIVLSLRELTGVVTVSYVDRFRDGRGWAFRPATGPDPVNGFAFLREAYVASDPDHRGAVSIPVLWDRALGRIVSDDPDTIDVDLAVAFEDATGTDLHPTALSDAIDELGRQSAALADTISLAVYRDNARRELRQHLHALDESLRTRPHLLGEELTLADVRLWTVLVRYDAGPNAHGAAGPSLATFPHLWEWARRLYRLPAFHDTTDFDAFRAPLTVALDWNAP